jgi:queuine tRNA-ribosyltransferase
MHSLDGIPDFPFRVEAEDGGARAGVLETPRGVVHTPCFMPVGTKGTVKALTPDRLRSTGAQMVLANAYHLALRPGSDVVRTLGGLHRFMAWDGPILTDSGGYQVFSLRDTVRIDDTGAEFLSIYDGSRQVFTPERAMAEQADLGADLVMCLDQCPPAGAPEAVVAEAVDRTDIWAQRCKRFHQAREGSGNDGPQMLLGIAQGGVIPRLRRVSIQKLLDVGFPGYALGGLSVGEDRSAMLETVESSTQMLPADRLRYFMGIGDPVGLVEVIARGADLFDCVLPTRTARMGTAFTKAGRLNLRNAEHTCSMLPLERGCPCTACVSFSRGAIRHFVMQNEMLGLALLTEHNLVHVIRVLSAAREAIMSGRFGAFRRDTDYAW